MPSVLARSRFTRRTATVTMSAPDAEIACVIVSLSRYFPVPTIKRDRNVRPPMVSGMSFRTASAVVIASSASHEMHELDRIARRHAHRGEGGPAHDRAIVLHHDGPRVEVQRLEQVEQRPVPHHRPWLTVYDDVDGVAHVSNSCRSNRAASGPSTVSQNARIAATPCTPAALRDAARPGVTPPMAITGSPKATMAASVAGSSGARAGCVAVGNTGPTKR